MGAGIGGADGAGEGVSVDWDELKHFFQISMPIRKRARAIPIMAAGEVNVCWFDLVEFLEQLACIEFPVVLGPESLNGHVDALGVGPAEEFCQFTSPIHGLLLDFDCLGFIC